MIQKDTNYKFLSMKHFSNNELSYEIYTSLFDLILFDLGGIIIFSILLFLSKKKLYILTLSILRILKFSILFSMLTTLESVNFFKKLYWSDYAFYLKSLKLANVNIVYYAKTAHLNVNVMNGDPLSMEAWSFTLFIYIIYTVGKHFSTATVDIELEYKHTIAFLLFFFITGVVLHTNSPGIAVAYLASLIIGVINYGLKTWINLKNKELLYFFKNIKLLCYVTIIFSINQPTVSEILLNEDFQHASTNPLSTINLFYILVCLFIIVYAYFAVEASKYSPHHFLFVVYSSFTIGFIFIYVNCLCCQLNQHPEPLDSQIYILVVITTLLIIIQIYYRNDSVQKLLFILINMWLYTIISYLYLAQYITVAIFKLIFIIYSAFLVFFTLNYPYTKKYYFNINTLISIL